LGKSLWIKGVIMAKYYHNINGVNIAFTAEEEAAQDILVADYNSKSIDRKLKQIKEIRLSKLQKTDWMAMSDLTMSNAWKTKRQSWRDIPQNNSTEEEYDLLLARETDKSKDNFGQLTHSIWNKP
jgi:hypothetical protein